jgi:carbon-monoxide dehydrogenase medium subunit
LNQNINFHKPESAQAASKLLIENPNAIIVAGGTDLVVKFRNGMLPLVTDFIDITDLPFNKIEKKDDHLIIGSGCTMSEVINNPEVKKHFPTLVKAASTVGALQIRNAATIGGNSGNASPAGDTIPALFSIEAKVIATDGQKQREIAIEEFFTGPGKTSLERGEMIEAFKIPLRETQGAFIKLGERQAHAISKINMALTTWKSQEGTEFRVAMGSVAPTVIRCPELEKHLKASGLPLSEEGLAKAIELASESAKPIDDVRSTREYRKKMAGILIKKAVEAIN